jgi:hypothetical protein
MPIRVVTSTLHTHTHFYMHREREAERQRDREGDRERERKGRREGERRRKGADPGRNEHAATGMSSACRGQGRDAYKIRQGRDAHNKIIYIWPRVAIYMATRDAYTYYDRDVIGMPWPGT